MRCGIAIDAEMVVAINRSGSLYRLSVLMLGRAEVNLAQSPKPDDPVEAG